MNLKNSYTLTTPQTGNLAFKIQPIDETQFDHIQRLNYYSLIWVLQGTSKLKADFSDYDFSDDCLLSFSPYQPFMLIPEGELKGVAIHFHSDFYCVHKHQEEVSCNGVLFNNVYEKPSVKLSEGLKETLDQAIGNMQAEMQNPATAQYDLLLSHLKIVLIMLTREKKAQFQLKNTEEKETPQVLKSLKQNIEKHYRQKHSASDYADLLAITPKALAKLTKQHFNKTITDLISERIMVEAKRELFLTNKPVKEIAYELGYNDEYYFSRFFKKNADVSPQLYRETAGQNNDWMISWLMFFKFSFENYF